MPSDAKPTNAEPEASKLAGLSLDSSTPSKPNGTNPGASNFTPSAKFSWADDATTPTSASDNKAGDAKSELAKAQTDGATTWLQGSAGLDEPEFDVNVKLADLQDDPNNPLYSVKSFDELKL